MTMFTLPNFCRVCLKYDKNLIDLAHIENEPSETLMSKLQLCVSEVEWNTFKPLLCHPCIKRLNIAYSFKKQCVQSAGVLKNYVELVKESQKKNESQSAVKTENSVTPGGAYMLLPNQKYVKILVGSQNQGTTGNTFQNVFLNLIPTTALNTVTSVADNISTPKTKDTNQNVFLNLNNTFQKFIPIAPVNKKQIDIQKKVEIPKLTNVNVTQLLTESKAEEMSVEIDPTSFLQLEHDDEDSNEDEEANDWDEVITQTKIDPNSSKVINGEKATNGKESNMYGNYVPILPKQDDFLSSGHHFLSGSYETNVIACETCQKPFASVRLLKQHIKQFHLGKLPFKCEYCYTEHATRGDYDLCVNRHKLEADTSGRTSLTLKDFANPSVSESLSISLIKASMEANIRPDEDGNYVCDVCRRIFNSSTGLLRHKVRKHNQKNKKKYFIKGMKNARCDICNREFSTQSYMQLHRKLHLRDDIGYKYKVLGKSKYSDLEDKEKDKSEEGSDGKHESSENIEVTPDIKQEVDEEYEEDGSSEEEEEEEDGHVSKKIKRDEEESNDSHIEERERDSHIEERKRDSYIKEEEQDEEDEQIDVKSQVKREEDSDDSVNKMETDNGESDEDDDEEDDEEESEENEDHDMEK